MRLRFFCCSSRVRFLLCRLTLEWNRVVEERLLVFLGTLIHRVSIARAIGIVNILYKDVTHAQNSRGMRSAPRVIKRETQTIE